MSEPKLRTIPPAPQSGANVDDDDAAPSSGPVSAHDVDAGAPPSEPSADRIRAEIGPFIASRKDDEGRAYVIRVVKKMLGREIARELLEDLVHNAIETALEMEWPPWTMRGVRSWVGRLTRRSVAHYFEARKDDKENLDHEVPVDWTADRHAPQTDELARARLIHEWMARQIGDDPRKVETLALMVKHEVDGFPVSQLAEDSGATAIALYNRFHKLRLELAPQVRVMDDEKKRRAFILLLIFSGVSAVLAALLVLVLWLLGFLYTPGALPEDHALRPTHELHVEETPAVFNQSFPTNPDNGATGAKLAPGPAPGPAPAPAPP